MTRSSWAWWRTPPAPSLCGWCSAVARNYHLAREHILEAMPGTVAHLVRRSGYERHTVNRWLAKLHAGKAAERGAHVGAWDVPEGRGAAYVAIWHAGPGADARRPQRATSSAAKHAKAVAKHGRKKLAAQAANRYHRRQRRAGRTDPLLAPFLAKPCQNETT
jgi:hypothetical protein